MIGRKIDYRLTNSISIKSLDVAPVMRNNTASACRVLKPNAMTSRFVSGRSSSANRKPIRPPPRSPNLYATLSVVAKNQTPCTAISVKFICWRYLFFLAEKVKSKAFWRQCVRRSTLRPESCEDFIAIYDSGSLLNGRQNRTIFTEIRRIRLSENETIHYKCYIPHTRAVN
jgi:hypothetical protein